MSALKNYIYIEVQLLRIESSGLVIIISASNIKNILTYRNDSYLKILRIINNN
jgi:hypothetical protein